MPPYQISYAHRREFNAAFISYGRSQRIISPPLSAPLSRNTIIIFLRRTSSLGDYSSKSHTRLSSAGESNWRNEGPEK